MKTVLALLFAAALAAADEPPAWLLEASTSKHPAYPASTPAVVLRSEEKVVASATGEHVTSTRYAVKILNRQGRREAQGAIFYNSGAGRIRDFRAWVIYPSGKHKEYGKNDFTEGAAMPSYALYSSLRYRAIDAGADCDPGAVFGYEVVSEEKTVFSQFTYSFQDELPSLLSRFTLQAPAGWQVQSHFFGSPAPAADTATGTYTWTLRDLPPMKREDDAPSMSSVLARVAVSLAPPDGAAPSASVLACFRNWKDVSQWQHQLASGQAEATAAIRAKAAELTANAAGEIERIGALAKFVQQIRYVAVQLNLHKGGGYVPHPAAEVLAKAYGDCKDKANLLKAMLSTIGVESYLVIIHSGDPFYAKPEWASPYQFNHAILAIRLPKEAAFPAAFDDPSLGRLLLFDPTDENVPFGYIPLHEQGSRALLLSPETKDLLETPLAPASANHRLRKISARLSAAGEVTATAVETRSGQLAFSARAMQNRLSPEDYRKSVESRLSRSVAGAQLTKLENTAAPGGALQQTLEFTAKDYWRSMQEKLFIVKPAVLSLPLLPDVTEAERKTPLVLDAISLSETVEMEIPAGTTVDELPDSYQLNNSWGRYSASWKSAGGKIVFERTLEVQRKVLEPSGWPEAREFFRKVYGSDEAPVVLIKN